MFKKFGLVALFYLYISAAFSATLSSCPGATATNEPGFCSSFITAAKCHCTEILFAGRCDDMNQIYSRMIDMFKSIDRACRFQRSTNFEDCMDNWNCYLNGIDSHGRTCNKCV